jgi:hypothetical protein
MQSARPAGVIAANPPRLEAGVRTEVFRPRLLDWGLGLLLSPLLVGLYLLLVPEPPFPRWVGAVVVALDLLLTGMVIGKRTRSRIEVSARGLLVIHDVGTHQADWADVRMAERVGMDEDERLVLVKHAGARFVLDLDGYRDRHKAEIWQRVRDCTSTRAEGLG